jgi:hypothetical protein
LTDVFFSRRRCAAVRRRVSEWGFRGSAAAAANYARWDTYPDIHTQDTQKTYGVLRGRVSKQRPDRTSTAGPIGWSLGPLHAADVIRISADSCGPTNNGMKRGSPSPLQIAMDHWAYEPWTNMQRWCCGCTTYEDRHQKQPTNANCPASSRAAGCGCCAAAAPPAVDRYQARPN